MNCIMHQGHPYGHLTRATNDGDKDVLRHILPEVLARIVGSTRKEVDALLAELHDAGVFSRTSDGVNHSRRMVRDEGLREARGG
jgi:hypothetical protein